MEEKIFFNNLERKKKAIGLIHKVYLSQLKTKRKYTASTKTKSEVRGGGKKPWRQKGTGNARAGSTRSPLWVGGGVSFGPKPRIVNKKINKKERRLAILSAFYLKKKECIFLEENFFE
jgi:large subunit ribosomal protein L4